MPVRSDRRHKPTAKQRKIKPIANNVYRSGDPVTTPVIWLQSHHRALAAQNIPACDSGVYAEYAHTKEKTTNYGSDRREQAHAI